MPLFWFESVYYSILKCCWFFEGKPTEIFCWSTFRQTAWELNVYFFFVSIRGSVQKCLYKLYPVVSITHTFLQGTRECRLKLACEISESAFGMLCPCICVRCDLGCLLACTFTFNAPKQYTFYIPFRKQSISWMYSVDIVFLGHADDLGDAQVRFHRCHTLAN